MRYGRPWWGRANRCFELVEKFLRDGALVLLETPEYYGKKIYGFRQAGPLFYLTRSIDILEKFTVDTAVYCGKTAVSQMLQAKNVYADRRSYDQMAFAQLTGQLENTGAT